VKIPEEKIQEIREATDIVEIVSQYVTLKKQGKSYIGLCPFHTEKTPSFSVNPGRGFYHCFGCGAGGNVFTFTMQMERVSFPEAIRTLADKAGIPLPKYEADDQKTKEIETLYHINHFAANFFQECLFESENGRKVLQYLKKRGMEEGIVKRFQLGYAPQAWDELLNRAKKSSINLDMLNKSGLIVPRKDSTGHYDRFRNRLMFPILNVSGRVVGFGGRILSSTEKGPKYINSPETPIYQKGKLLYGLFRSKSGIQRVDRVLLVEGYTDLMQLHQYGFDYSVATSGTALTDEQAKLIRRYTKNVILLFDGDSAGFSAAIRGIDILLDNGLKVEIIALPKGSDPDSYLRKEGQEPFQQLLNTAKSFLDFQLDQMKDRGKLKTPSDRAVAARHLLQVFQKIRDPLERNVMVKDLAEKLNIEEGLIWQEVRNQKKQNVPKDSQKLTTKGSAGLNAAERGILAMLLENDKKWFAPIFQFLKPEDFQNLDARILYQTLHQEYLKKGEIDSQKILDHFIDNIGMTRYLTQYLSEQIDKAADRYQLGLDCLLLLKQNKIQIQIQEVREEMKRIKMSDRETSELSEKYINLKKDYNTIKREITEVWEKNS
jgi:DNA primase